MGALPEGQRFSSDHRPDNRTTGRTRTSWLREIMSEAANDDSPGGDTHRQAIARHLIRVASSFDVVVKGQGDKAIQLASARDSVEAAKILYQYDLGKPPASDGEARLALAEHFRKVEADRFNFARELLGDRIRSMKPAELAEFFSRLAPDVRGFLKMADGSTEPTAIPVLESSSTEPGSSSEPASPKDRGMADHAGPIRELGPSPADKETHGLNPTSEGEPTTPQAPPADDGSEPTP